MNTYKRKAHKLIQNPTVFFRDYFMKKAPLNYGENIPLLEVEDKTKEDFSNKKKPLIQVPSLENKVTVNEKKIVKKNNKTQAIEKKNNSKDSFIAEDLYEVMFPIDIVYTWVDGNDPEFITQKNKYLKSNEQRKPETFDNARFESRDELLYSLRSVEKYAPWVNHIYIVTNVQKPSWLNLNNPKVSIISHSEIIDKKYLPTFNSHVIESCIHRIPNLSENYLYLNDDVFFTRPVNKNYFYTSAGLSKLFVTNSILPNGPHNITDTPTQLAAKNARKLIFNNFDIFPNNMFAHTFHPQNKSIQQLLESKFPNEFDKMRINKFRDNTDLPTATFMNHHVSLILGKALTTRTTCFYFNVRSAVAPTHYKTLLARKNTDLAPYSMCLNDVTSNSKSLNNYEEKLEKFLSTYYPEKSFFEI